jgi:hypothetical protein
MLFRYNMFRYMYNKLFILHSLVRHWSHITIFSSHRPLTDRYTSTNATLSNFLEKRFRHNIILYMRKLCTVY